MKVCAEPRCPELTATTYCPTHTAAAHARHDRQRPNRHSRGYDAQWRRTRSAHLAEHPTCQQSGCYRPAVDVHHLDGLGPNGPRGHDHANLQALCHPHHAAITARAQRTCTATWRQPTP